VVQTLTEIAAEKNSRIVFPLRIDLIQMLLEGRGSAPGNNDIPRNVNIPHAPAAA
jgi:hypothetical protein